MITKPSLSLQPNRFDMKRYNDRLRTVCLMYTDGVCHCFVDNNDDIFYSDGRPKSLRIKYIYFKTR